MRTLTLTAALAVAALTASAEPIREVNVNVDMTPEGQKLTRPTPQAPEYYLPVFEGYRELGATVAGEKKPEDNAVKSLIAKSLAAQGYLPITDNKHGAPQILIVFYWGYMNPVTMTGADDNEVGLNKNQELALVAGKGYENLDLGLEMSEIVQASTEDRYFIVAQAYDYAAARKHQRKLLWAAKMSTATSGVTIDQVLPTLIKAGSPLMGRETYRPKMIILPLVPAGKVDIGIPEVKDYQDVPPPPPKAKN